MEHIVRWFRIVVSTTSGRRVICTQARSTADAVENVISALSEEPGPIVIIGRAQ